MRSMSITLLGVVSVTAMQAQGVELSRTWSFTSSAQGWQTVEMPYGTHVVNPQRGAAPLDLQVGYPAAPSLRVHDIFNHTGVATPSSYGGNLLWAYGQAPSAMGYFAFVRGADNVAYPAIMLNCGSDSLYFLANYSTLTNVWTQFGIRLVESDWRLASSNQVPSRTQFASLIANVTAIYIRTEYRNTLDDDTNIDSVTLPQPLYSGDFNKDGTVNFPDLLTLAKNYGTVFSPNNTPDLTWSFGDATGDYAVNFNDLLALARNYEKTMTASLEGESAAASLVPEPATLGAAGAALFLLARRQRATSAV